MKKVVGIGEILWDMFPEGKQPGGAPANFAWQTSQLGLDAYAVSAIGNDTPGREIADLLKAKKLNVILECVDYPTGTVKVALDTSGVPTYEICENVAWDNIPLTQEMRNLAQQTDAVCFGTLAQRSSVSRKSISGFVNLVPANAYKIFDINLRQHYYDKELIHQCLQVCNVLKINDDELKVLMQMYHMPDPDEVASCRFLMDKYKLEIAILTKGTNGSFVLPSGGEHSFKPTPEVVIADTVGAGDSFTAAFVAALLNGKPLSEAHQAAVNLAAYVCSQKGGMPVLKTSQ